MNKVALLLTLVLSAAGSAATLDAQDVLTRRRSVPPSAPTPPAYYPPPLHGRVPTIGRLPLFEPVDAYGPTCTPFTDQAAMTPQRIARAWTVTGAMGRQSFIGLDANGRVRYLMDSMRDLSGPWRDFEQATIHFHSNGSVEEGRRGAWNISGDAGNILPQTAGLFPQDTARAYRYAVQLARLCAGARFR